MAALVRIDLGRGYLTKMTEDEAVKFLAANPGAKRWERGKTSAAPDKTDKFFPPEPEGTEAEGTEDGEGEGVEVPPGEAAEAELTGRKPRK